MKTIRFKFLVFSLLLSTIPLTILGFISFRDSSHILQETTYQRLSQMIQDFQRDIDNHLLTRLSAVRFLSESSALAAFSRLRMEKRAFDMEVYHFQRLNGLKLDPFPSVGDLVNFGVGLSELGGKKILDFGLYPSEEYVGLDGIVRQHVYAGGSNDQDFQEARLEKLDRSQEIWFQEAKKGNSYISNPHYRKLYVREYTLAQVGFRERVIEKKLIVLAVPHRVQKELRGVLMVTTTPDMLYRQVNELTSNYGTSYIVTNQGTILAHPNPEKEDQKIETKLLTLLMDSGKERKTYRGQMLICSSSSLTGWILVLNVPKEWVLQPIARLRFKPFIILGVTVVVTSVLMIWITNRFVVNPLQVLSRESEIIAGGKYSHRLKIYTGDEIERLALVLNTLAEKVQSHTENLEMLVWQRTEELQKKNRQLEEALEQLKITQDQLIQSEKMGSLGQMLSGVAHEINNPLAIIKMFTELLMMDLASDKDKVEILKKMDQATDRAKRIIQSLLTIARKHKPEKRFIDVNQVLEGVLELRSYYLQVSNIEVIKNLQPNLPQILADFHQLQQVFLNIILNAEQAMQETRRRGRLTIQSQLIGSFQEPPLLKTSALNTGEKLLHPTPPFIRVSITDEGPGIPPENLKRIFDPFFTTKDVGKGTGLGLSISYTIIQEHEGKIYATSEWGRGTTFFVELPVKVEEDKSRGTSPLPRNQLSYSASLEKRVLVVDDESTILEILSEILQKLGYKVDASRTAATALENLNSKLYDFIITDIKMPHMGGQELYQQVKQQDPKLANRIIFITGDLLSEDTVKFIQETGNFCLAKPFSVEELQRILHQLSQIT
jgi:signal transduction histidine kinase/BarA-like signal transduction histidine kinase